MSEQPCRPKIHHYVPQFLLRNFAVPSSGQICVFDKRDDKIFQTNVKNTAAEKSLYDIEFPKGVLSAESSLSNLEGSAAHVIFKILREENLSQLTEDDKIVMCLFIGTQMLRVPHQVQTLHQMTEIIRKKWGAVPGMPVAEESREQARQTPTYLRSQRTRIKEN